MQAIRRRVAGVVVVIVVVIDAVVVVVIAVSTTTSGPIHITDEFEGIFVMLEIRVEVVSGFDEAVFFVRFARDLNQVLQGDLDELGAIVLKLLQSGVKNV